MYIAHSQSHTSFHSSLCGITLYSTQVFYPCKRKAKKTTEPPMCLGCCWFTFLTVTGCAYLYHHLSFPKWKNPWLLTSLMKFRSELYTEFWYCATLLLSPQAEYKSLHNIKLKTRGVCTMRQQFWWLCPWTSVFLCGWVREFSCPFSQRCKPAGYKPDPV